MANNRIRGQAEITDSGGEMRVIAEAMVIHSTSHTPKTGSGAGRTEAEVCRFDCVLLGSGGLYGTQGRDGAELKKQ